MPSDICHFKTASRDICRFKTPCDICRFKTMPRDICRFETAREDAQRYLPFQDARE